MGHKTRSHVLRQAAKGNNNKEDGDSRHGGDDRAFAQTGELCESTAPSGQIPPVVWLRGVPPPNFQWTEGTSAH